MISFFVSDTSWLIPGKSEVGYIPDVVESVALIH